MRSYLFAAFIFVSLSCQNQFSASIQRSSKSEAGVITDVMDFQARRLSGSRVMISWHAELNKDQNDFLVMRRLGTSGLLEKVAVVKPKQSNAVNDYSLTDLNECTDSSFYSVLQVDSRGVKYFSLARGVGGKRN